MTSVLAHPVPDAPPGRRGRDGRRFGAVAALLGLFASLVSVAGSWQPSYWGDEAASVMSAERSLPSLFRMLGHVDAVHGAYYVVLHFWIGVFGASELSTRAPSALGVGLAGAGTVVLARQLANARVAVTAGVVFAVLPRVTYMGAEARSTALATAVAAWLTVVLVHTLRSGRYGWARARRWAAYALLLATGIYLFLDLLLLIPVHAVAVALLGKRPLPWRAWTLATLSGLLLTIPVLHWGLGQSSQLRFIGRRPQFSVVEAAVHQWFGTPVLAALAWGLIVLAIATLLVLRTDLPAGVGTTRRALVVVLAWMIVPSAALLIGTHLVMPMYALRYLSFCTPAAAIAIALGIACFRPRPLRAIAILAVLVLAAPTYVAQRGEFGKNEGSDLRQSAEIIRARAHPGDAVVFDETTRHSRRPRLALHLYPQAFAGLHDVGLERPYDLTDSLWDTTRPLDESVDRLAGIRTVWLLQLLGSRGNRSHADVATLEQQGFIVVGSTIVHRTEIIEMTR